MEIIQKNDVEKVILKLIRDNEGNEKTSVLSGYNRGYFEGFHDACVDILHGLGIETSEEYYNE